MRTPAGFAFLFVPFLAIACLLAPLSARAADAPAKAQEAMLTMVTAIIESNRADFVTNATSELQESLTEADFAAVVEQIAPVLKQGFKTRYLGQMKQQGFDVYIWVVSIRGEEDEMLATLSMKDGKVGGFYLE